ncbi:hypothetical protein V6N11_067550 [Hibiscus sabdariffa]|uniref:RNase H type-1 domain-containing protein n=1 Tax=Hibiscus sabdariffa TaxID=183260 RepID=A0ABR2SS07_9ROSI
MASTVMWLGQGALPGNTIIDDIRELLSRNWVVCIRRISRDGNMVADALTRSVRDGPIGAWLFNEYPVFISPLLLKDACSISGVGSD